MKGDRPVLDELTRRAERIRLLILDVDGVLTDGKIYFGPWPSPGIGFSTLDGSGIRYGIMSPEAYVKMSGPRLEEEGFFEKEIHRVVEQFGPIAHVFSTYEARHSLADEKPFTRGINSFQLLNDGKRWWVVSIYWTVERADLPIPAKYLP